jgi:hypothetical protein
LNKTRLSPTLKPIKSLSKSKVQPLEFSRIYLPKLERLSQLENHFSESILTFLNLQDLVLNQQRASLLLKLKRLQSPPNLPQLLRPLSLLKSKLKLPKLLLLLLLLLLLPLLPRPPRKLLSLKLPYLPCLLLPYSAERD